VDTEDPVRRLRGAIYTGDAATIVAVLPRLEPAQCLQLAGDGVVIALGQQARGAREQAQDWVEKLRDRGWDGDDELADQIEAQLGSRAASMLRPLPVDLDELSSVLEGDPINGGGRIDLRTGEVWPDFVFENLDIDEDEDDDHWLGIGCEGSRSGYRDMQRFVDELPDPAQRDRLDRALQGRGAFRRFKDVLATWPDDLARWHDFSGERRRGRARVWLAANGYAAVPRTARQAS
jgi:hypothetical protein